MQGRGAKIQMKLQKNSSKPLLYEKELVYEDKLFIVLSFWSLRNIIRKSLDISIF